MTQPTTFTIPLVRPIWADERQWCKYARAFDIDAASHCPENRSGRCALNGCATPCVFDEPLNAPVWRDIKESVDEHRAKGW